MKEMLEIMIKNLVVDTDAVEIKEVNKGKETLYEVKVANNDMGKVIGKQGRMAKAIRTVARAIALKENKRIIIEFVE